MLFKSTKQSGNKHAETKDDPGGSAGDASVPGRSGGRAYQPAPAAPPQPFHKDVLRSAETAREAKQAKRGNGDTSDMNQDGETKANPDNQDGERGNTLIVGPNIRLKGEIAACDTLVVQGNIEASMDSQHIDIAKGGVFVGEVAVDTAEIAGSFEGTITVRDTLTLLNTGTINGTIRYGRLAVEGGGVMKGDVQLIEDEAAQRKQPANTNVGGVSKDGAAKDDGKAAAQDESAANDGAEDKAKSPSDRPAAAAGAR